MTKNVATEAGPHAPDLTAGSAATVNVGAGLRGTQKGMPSLVVILATLGLWEVLARIGILPERWSPDASRIAGPREEGCGLPPLERERSCCAPRTIVHRRETA